MSVVDMLNKKHKVMNCVFEILYDLYGEPVWLNKPKDGQEPEKIIEQWIKELGDYSETQLKQACYNLFKYKKVATFPKLAHILAELSDQQKENAPKQPSEKRSLGICLEVELMRRDIRLNKCKYTLPIYRAAFYYTISDLLKIKIGEREYTELEYSYRNKYLSRHQDLRFLYILLHFRCKNHHCKQYLHPLQHLLYHFRHLCK